jgi:hypothetical protein
MQFRWCSAPVFWFLACAGRYAVEQNCVLSIGLAKGTHVLLRMCYVPLNVLCAICVTCTATRVVIMLTAHPRDRP